MKKHSFYIRDGFLTAVLLALAFGISLLLQKAFNVEEHISTVFVFAVFLVSLLTRGYLFGILAAVAGTVAVNYAFTFPYFALNFTTPVNVVSGIIMVSIAVLTGALTTKLKHHETVKVESEKERMRANLLRAVSHDLRTPLTTIFASATTLLENGDVLTEEQNHQIITGIKEDSEWLVRMVENLLSVTRLDGGQVQIVKSPTVLDELIDSVMLKFKKRYPFQSVELAIPEEVVIIPMEALLIEQVLVNILENAVQHAEGMTRLALRVTVANGRAVFAIEDDGCGIAPKRLEKLFNGYAADEMADSHKKNAGIGLSVCAAIIKVHGGHIDAANRKTGGAVFRFVLDTEDVTDDTE